MFHRHPHRRFVPVVINEDMRAKALKQTEDIVGKLEVIRKRLELPQTADVLSMLAVVHDDRLARIIDEEEAKREPASDRDYLGGADVANLVGAHRIPMAILSTDKLGKPHRIEPGEIFRSSRVPNGSRCASRKWRSTLIRKIGS